MNGIYTGRRIAIFSDIHALFEPVEAIIDDINKLGIDEIYSLGDNIGLGPSPCDVIDMLECYNVKSVAGIFEEYCTLGFTSFRMNFDSTIARNHEWTLSELGRNRCDFIRNFPHSFDLNLGGKKVALCYFSNDVRTDYELYNKDTYLKKINDDGNVEQFLYTNSSEHKYNVKCNIDNFSRNGTLAKWYMSFLTYPIFEGKTISFYDSIIQGCIHKDLYSKISDTDIYSIGSGSLSFEEKLRSQAYYIILHEKVNNMGFDIEKRYVSFENEKMVEAIMKSKGTTEKIKKLILEK